MANKENMDAKVAELKNEFSRKPRSDPSGMPESAQSQAEVARTKTKETTTDASNATDQVLEECVDILKEHGVDIEDLKGLWEQLTAEVKDLPTKKPLLTMLGAFVIGVIIGRLSCNNGGNS